MATRLRLSYPCRTLTVSSRAYSSSAVVSESVAVNLVVRAVGYPPSNRHALMWNGALSGMKVATKVAPTFRSDHASPYSVGATLVATAVCAMTRVGAWSPSPPDPSTRNNRARRPCPYALYSPLERGLREVSFLCPRHPLCIVTPPHHRTGVPSALAGGFRMSVAVNYRTVHTVGGNPVIERIATTANPINFATRANNCEVGGSMEERPLIPATRSSSSAHLTDGLMPTLPPVFFPVRDRFMRRACPHLITRLLLSFPRKRESRLISTVRIEVKTRTGTCHQTGQPSAGRS